MNNTELFKHLIGCVDLSAPHEGCNTASIEALCAKAQTPHGNVAAVAVRPDFVAQTKTLLAGTGIKTAATISFPDGGEDTLTLEEETTKAISDGADEIELLMAHTALSEGRPGFAETQIVRIKRCCGDAILKVILEVGELPDMDTIREASDVALAAGADILVTASGKSTEASSQSQTEAVLASIAKVDVTKGLKIGESTSSTPDLMACLKSAQQIYGNAMPNARVFRVNGNAILDELLVDI